MVAGIGIRGSSRVKVIGAKIYGFDVGIDVSDSSDIEVSDANFKDVETGLKARRVRGLKASGCTDTDADRSKFRLTAVAKFVRNNIF